MNEKKDTPTLHEILDATNPDSPRKSVPYVEVTPPPSDWTSHPITRGVMILIIFGLGVLLYFKGPGWYSYLKAHPFGMWLTVGGIVVVIVIIIFEVWRQRNLSLLPEPHWDTEKKKKRIK